MPHPAVRDVGTVMTTQDERALRNGEIRLLTDGKSVGL